MYFDQLIRKDGRVYIASVKIYDYPTGIVVDCENTEINGLTVTPQTNMLNIWDDGWKIKE